MKSIDINKEKEYKKLFKHQKRWAKHWTTATAHRGHSSTIGMTEPANKTKEFIGILEEEDTTYKSRNEELLRFYIEEQDKEKKEHFLGIDYYFECIKFMKKLIFEIENGNEISVPLMPRS